MIMEGWLCPRCHKVNAPWVSQCSCGDENTNWSPDTDRTTVDPWWKEVTCSATDDGFNDGNTT